MKHTLKITLILVFIFFVPQVIGLSIINRYINHQTTVETGKVTFEVLPYNLERPQLEESTSYIWIFAAIVIGTLLMLLLVKFKKTSLWKLWFFLSVFFTLAIAFSAFINHTLAAIFAFILALMKIYKPTIIISNLTEIFIYGGLAAIFVPVINIFAALMLLILISVYDIIAVNHTKHMIKLAKFQLKSNIFAGLFIPYGKMDGKISKKDNGVKEKKEEGKTAVLGGGDIGFPLIFAGVVMKDLMLNNIEILGFLKTLIIPIFVSLALLYLLVKSKKDKFYPAMPYLTAGCIIGYIIVLIFF